MSASTVFASHVEKLTERGRLSTNDRHGILRDNPLAFDLSSEPITESVPWEQTEEFVPMIFALWDELKEKMLPCFQTRKSRCEEQDMLQGIVGMVAVFHWIKGKRLSNVQWDEIKKETFPVAPINWTERLDFILLKPTQYHCFIQLDELYTELKKQYGKHVALQKIKQKR
ncbi:YpoC family protein [Bacillus sp. 179-C3.3 HS]|uniref:YpoC family protein n=1 Tax=Bacillus sp. 179-C3.3 HS TaxID=3232162 RepID=UPI0039A1FFF9